MAFFSGQDTTTLQSEGNDTNCFVSLIVDTKGAYVAAITRKIVTKVQVAIKELGTSYEFFGDGTTVLEEVGGNASNSIQEKTVIEYFMLDVERHAVDNPLDYLDRRFEEIETAKMERQKEATKIWNPKEHTYDKWEGLSYRTPKYSDYDNSKSPVQLQIWKEEELPPKAPTIPEEEYIPDAKLIHACVCKMLSCSLMLNTEKFDLKQWATKHLAKMYDKAFGIPDEVSGWCEFCLPLFMSKFLDEDGIYTVQEIESAVAGAMYDEIFELKTPENTEYLNVFLEYLTEYL